PEARIVDSGSTNAVSFSSARRTKRFPSPRCASAIQIVHPSRSSAIPITSRFETLERVKHSPCPIIECNDHDTSRNVFPATPALNCFHFCVGRLKRLHICANAHRTKHSQTQLRGSPKFLSVARWPKFRRTMRGRRKFKRAYLCIPSRKASIDGIRLFREVYPQHCRRSFCHPALPTSGR